MKRRGLIYTALHLRGNQRACLWLEPMWGIPYNLYTPFVSVYMAALGMTPVMIGLSSTLFFISQMFWALLSAPLTDKLGRRKCTLIFDCLSWSLPTLLWAFAQGPEWFLLAAVLNGAWRVTENSWDLLLIEGAPSDTLISLYAISHVAGLLAGFIAPLGYLFVRGYGMVPTMRVMYLIAFICMTVKFVILFFWSKETEVGKRRMEECKNVSYLSRLRGLKDTLRVTLRDRRVLLVVGLLACLSSVKSIYGSFWPLLVTQKLNIAQENLSVFSTLKTLSMLALYFFLTPRLDLRKYRLPLRFGLCLLGGTAALMFFLPQGAYAAVICAVLAEALALAVLNPLSAALQMDVMEEEQRASTLALCSALCLLVTAPTGLLGGALSEINRALPMALCLLLCLTAVFFAVRLDKCAGEIRA